MKTVKQQMAQIVDDIIDGPMMGIEALYKDHYSLFWPRVKHAIDSEGWVCSRQVEDMLDSHFEQYLNRSVEFKDTTPAGPHYKWRPKSIGAPRRANS